MARGILSGKRLQIDKANAFVVLVVVVSAFVTSFSLVAAKALLSQRSYQSRVIAQKKIALKQLKDNNEAVKQLVASYDIFESKPINIIGGSSTGTGDRNGDNASIVLNALPSKYDFPALATSLEKILVDRSYKINEITGKDDELNQAAQGDTKPIQIPFELEVEGDITTLQGLMDVLQRSIRPIYVNKVEVSATDSHITISVAGTSYYQPQKTVKITTKDVK